MKQLFFVILFLFSGIFAAQTSCAFTKDSISIPKENKVIIGEILQTVFKNKTLFQLIKGETSKYYLKMIVLENLYFDHVDLLEIRSGSKSFYVKDTKQYRLDKHSGFYLVELYSNYVGTLKDEGITSIVFNKAETVFTKQDCAHVKQMSKCFYEAISPKK